jgi:hypothetical protein
MPYDAFIFELDITKSKKLRIATQQQPTHAPGTVFHSCLASLQAQINAPLPTSFHPSLELPSAVPHGNFLAEKSF